MTLDELLPKLFPDGNDVKRGPEGTISGTGKVGSQTVAILGIVDQTPPGIDGAIILSSHILKLIEGGKKMPIVMLVDTASQKMARRDEMLGLNEYLSHLYKSLYLARKQGTLTISILYGAAAAGAFIATCLSTQILVTVEGAYPSVMDLKSMSSVTTIPIEKLQDMAKTTPVFAPGAEHLVVTGAIHEIWDGSQPYADRLKSLLQTKPGEPDRRDQLGLERKGRLMAAPVAERVGKEAQASA